MAGNFAVYKSSAGSGKTYTLVKEYIKLAIGNKHTISKNYRQILAITFTNKAAAEMKGRILLSLKQIAEEKKTPMSADLQHDLKISEEDLKERCHTLHTCLLHQYADFAVSTIDSFVYRLVKRFSLDLQLPANFTVDTDEDTAIWWAIDSLLTNMEQNKALYNLILNYTSEKIEEQKNWRIEDEIFNLVKPILVSKKEEKEAGELSKISLPELLEIKKHLHAQVSKTEQHLSELAGKSYHLISQNNIPVSDFSYGESGFFGYFKKIKNKVYSDEDLKSKRVDAAVYEDKWYSGKKANPAIDAIKNELIAVYNETENYRKNNLHNYFLYKILLKNIHALCVLNEVHALVQQYKEEKNTVFISEFNTAVSNFIQKEPVPFIYERLGDRYKHYLVDEFQDTSALQWLNLLPLVHNSLSEGKKCLVVGDGKQSIYRWRGADVEQFISLPHIVNAAYQDSLEEQQQALISNYAEYPLNTNRRSYSNIIQFNNHLFEWLSGNYLSGPYKKVYEYCAQQMASKEGGIISLSFIQKETENSDEAVLQQVSGHIHEALQQGYACNDIAILTRNNRNGSSTAQYLMQQGIPVISSDSLLLKTNEEVNFIIALLTWLNNRHESVAAGHILMYLKEHLKHPVSHEHLNKAAVYPYRLPFILDELGIPATIENMSGLPLFEICTETIRQFHLENKSPLFMNFFLDEVAAFGEKEGASVFLFLQWWKQKNSTLSVKMPQNINAVRVLTIHASKGLEFPVVIMPFADWKIQNTEQILIETKNEIKNLPVALVKTGNDLKQTAFKALSEEEEEKQILDNLNLLYVACTRAVDGLHIISREPKRGAPVITNWLQTYVQQNSWDKSENNTYRSGSYPAKENIEEKEAGFLSPITYRNVHEAVQIKLSSPGNDAQLKREYGIALHEVISGIKTKEDIKPVLQKALLDGLINMSQFEKWRQDFHEIISHPLLKDYFSGKATIKTETELFTNTGEIIRPDRIAITGGHTAVIDFKTGEKSAKYVQQIKAYKQTLKQIIPTEVKAFLVYMPGEVVEVI